MRHLFLNKRISSFQIIILGFLAVILLGAMLLMLPFCTRSGIGTSFPDALFTAASAVCVTGLVIRDTATYWSVPGQVIILLLIQIGGLGVVSITAFFALLAGRKISLFQRTILQDNFSAPQIGGIVKLIRFIFLTVFIVEFLGFALMLPSFVGKYGRSGIWMSAFHSVSAFCNAGFDLMGTKSGAFSSLSAFGNSIPVNLVISLLIVTGGIGFLTWNDIATHRFTFRKYRLQSKVILLSTLILILIPAGLFYLNDFAAFPVRDRICMSIFQAITPRTAGFNTADLNAMSSSGRVIMIILMLIGGSPGSTAGGIKTTTVAVLIANGFSVFTRRSNVQLMGRRVEDSVVKSAATLLYLYFALSVGGAMAISTHEGLPFGSCLFETASAIGTVGLSLGLTPTLGMLSRAILIFLMFFGRVGGLTLIFAAVSLRQTDSRCPIEKITVG
ncbi:MAG: Trk family potassium uptake protein [Lachnospiraceae bacterium]|nr:Trk family potassium uptake protein [Lachnospiraceae bacterium]